VASLLAGLALAYVTTKADSTDKAGAADWKVFFLLGQSNMEGQGIVKISDGSGDGNGTLEYAVKNRPSASLPVYDFEDMASQRAACNPKDVSLDDLVKSDGSWQSWPNVQVDYFGKVGSQWGMVHPKGDLSVGFGVNSQRGVGPELGFGVEMAKHYGESTNVLLVKVAWGGTSLAEDWRPPSSVAGYGGDVGWCYTNFTAHAHEVLSKLGSYEIAGMVWHQGWNDGCSMPQVQEYERNMANLIKDIRSEFNVPSMKVSIPVSGLDAWRGTVDRRLGIIKAQFAVTQYPENEGTVGAQETRGFVRFYDESNGACNQGYHYNCNGESYYYLGSVAGQSMSALLDGTWKQPYINTTVVRGNVVV